MSASPYALPPSELQYGLSSVVYRFLVRTASTLTDEMLSVHLANYRTAYQLALDGNLPGEERANQKAVAKKEGFCVAARLSRLLGNSPVVPTVFF